MQFFFDRGSFCIRNFSEITTKPWQKIKSSMQSLNSAHLRYDHLFPWNAFVLPACPFTGCCHRFGWHFATTTRKLIFARWGCFIAGMSFACLAPPHHAHHVERLRKWVLKWWLCYFWSIFWYFLSVGFWLVPKVWVKQTKRVTSWMISLELSRWDPQSHVFFVRWCSDAWRIIRILYGFFWRMFLLLVCVFFCQSLTDVFRIPKAITLQSCVGCFSVSKPLRDLLCLHRGLRHSCLQAPFYRCNPTAKNCWWRTEGKTTPEMSSTWNAYSW